MVYYSLPLHQPIPRNLLPCKREHTCTMEESGSVDGTACRNLAGVTANYLLVTDVECTSHEALTHSPTTAFIASAHTYNNSSGVNCWSTLSKGRFWIKTVFYKRPQITSEKRGKFGKTSLQTPEDPCFCLFIGNCVSLNLPIIYF